MAAGSERKRKAHGARERMVCFDHSDLPARRAVNGTGIGRLGNWATGEVTKNRGQEAANNQPGRQGAECRTLCAMLYALCAEGESGGQRTQ